MAKLKNLIASSLIVLSSVSFAAEQNLEYLPTAAQWAEHTSVLAKYWMHPDAQGVPLGNFPTWRCDDGTLRNQKSCKGEGSLGNMLELSGIDFVRMQARQTFAYGVLFNLTGDEQALKLHKAGVDFLLKNARDPEGGFYSLMKQGKPLTADDHALPVKRLQRTSQDLSYALVGLAMNAYLTHDPEVIKVIMDSGKYIYDTYFDEKADLMRWCLEDSKSDKTTQKELVALLDQINAYMVLTLRLIPQDDKKAFVADLDKTVDSINNHFYNKDRNRFFGCIDNKSCFDLKKGRHLDNGHTVKAFWMEYLVACMTGNEKLKEFAKRGMLTTLHSAQTDEHTNWYGDLLKKDASWWEYAELDQSALTLALTGDYELQDTLRPWVNDYVDRQYGELNHFGLKTFFWRNGFHSTEHALIGTILSNAIRANACSDDKCRAENRVKLYFAPVNSDDTIFTPYLYSGKIVSVKDRENVKEVTFENIALPVKAY